MPRRGVFIAAHFLSRSVRRRWCFGVSALLSKVDARYGHKLSEVVVARARKSGSISPFGLCVTVLPLVVVES